MAKKQPRIKRVATVADDPSKWKYHHVKGNLIELWEKGLWVAVPTNGSIDKNGLAVMGKSLARAFAERVPGLKRALGRRLKLYGNFVSVFPKWKIITVPTKHDWKQSASVELIKRSLQELDAVLNHDGKHYGGRITHVYLPRLGCGEGGLDFARQVEPVIAVQLRNDSRYTLVSLPEDYEAHYDGHQHTEGSHTGRRNGDAFRDSVPPSNDGQPDNGGRLRRSSRRG